MVEFTAPWPLPHEQVLLQELNHRINNEFTTAISVVSLAAASSRNDKVKTALTAVAEMLTTMLTSIVLCRCRSTTTPCWTQRRTSVDFVFRSADLISTIGTSHFRWRLSLCCCRRIVVGGWE